MKRKVMITILAVVAAIAILFSFLVVATRKGWIWRDVMTNEPRTLQQVFGGWLFGSPTEIKKGFSSELLEGLRSRYHLSIPDNAVFIKGFNTNSRDPSVVVLFECPMTEENPSDLHEYVFRALELDEEIWKPFGRNYSETEEWFEVVGGSLEWEIAHQTEVFTHIQFSVCEDVLTVRLVGWRPGAQYP